MKRKEFTEFFNEEVRTEFELEKKSLEESDPENAFASLAAFILAHSKATITALEKMGVLKFED